MILGVEPVIVYSTFCTCSRSFSISALICKPSSVICQPFFAQPWRLRKQSVGLALHFLQQEIELLAHLAALCRSVDRIAPRGCAAAPVLRLTSARSASSAASCAIRAGSMGHAFRAILPVAFSAAARTRDGCARRDSPAASSFQQCPSEATLHLRGQRASLLLAHLLQPLESFLQHRRRPALQALHLLVVKRCRQNARCRPAKPRPREAAAEPPSRGSWRKVKLLPQLFDCAQIGRCNVAIDLQPAGPRRFDVQGDLHVAAAQATRAPTGASAAQTLRIPPACARARSRKR